LIIIKHPDPQNENRVLTSLEVDSLLGFDSAIYVEKGNIYVIWEGSSEGKRAYDWLEERPVEVEMIEQANCAMKIKFIHSKDEMLFRLTFIME
jgi:hypothetical protein